MKFLVFLNYFFWGEPKDYGDKKFLLVDDFLTFGRSLSDFARYFKEHGGENIGITTLDKSKYRKDTRIAMSKQTRDKLFATYGEVDLRKLL